MYEAGQEQDGQPGGAAGDSSAGTGAAGTWMIDGEGGKGTWDIEAAGSSDILDDFLLDDDLWDNYRTPIDVNNGRK